jgi:hypothetical protein
VIDTVSEVAWILAEGTVLGWGAYLWLQDRLINGGWHSRCFADSYFIWSASASCSDRVGNMRKGKIEIGQRYAEVKDGDRWTVVPFESVRTGEVFRLWLCVAKDGDVITQRRRFSALVDGVEVDVWKCIEDPTATGKTWAMTGKAIKGGGNETTGSDTG